MSNEKQHKTGDGSRSPLKIYVSLNLIKRLMFSYVLQIVIAVKTKFRIYKSYNFTC